MRRIVLLLALVLVPAASADALTIETARYGVSRLGPLDTRSTPRYSPTVSAARRAFGRPSNLFPNGGGGCVGKWRRLGLRIVFADFGGGSAICADGKAQSFTIHRSRAWRTWNGLRIGMPQAEVRQRHPRARWVDTDRFYPDGWWLRSSISPYGDGGTRTPVLGATVRGADPRVSSFFGWIGAAGE